MKNNKIFYQIPYNLHELNLSWGAKAVYMALKVFEFRYATKDRIYFIASNSDIQKELGGMTRNTLCKYKTELRKAGAIVEMPPSHIALSPTEMSQKGFCTYFLPDLSATKEEQQEQIELAYKQYRLNGFVSSKLTRQ